MKITKFILIGVPITLTSTARPLLANPIPTPAQPSPLLGTRTVLNSGFDQPMQSPGAGWAVPEGYGTNPPAIWQTTEDTAPFANALEIWNGIDTGNGGPTAGAHSGRQYAELNGSTNASLYQDVCILPQETVNWSVWHAARYSGQTNTMRVSITAPSLWTGKTPPSTALYNSGNLTTSYSQGWLKKSGSWVSTNTQPQNLRFAFGAIQGSLGNTSLGNFIDDVNLQLSPIIDFAPTDTVRNVNLATTTEGNGGNYYYLTVRINGIMQTPGSVKISLSGLNAQRNFTLGNVLQGTTALAGLSATQSGNNITLNIPAGSYDPNQPAQYIHLPIDFGDTLAEPNDNLTFTLSNPTGGGSSALQIPNLSITSTSCIGSPRTAVNTTLIDDDVFSISGIIFEDPNYGGGDGRNFTTAGTSPRDNATVELYESNGTYVRNTVTTGGGKYTFSNLLPGDYFIRVVNSTVTSSRTGYVNTLLPVQTFRTDASNGTVTAVTDRVGGEIPAEVDPGTNSGSQTVATLNGVSGQELQSITTVKVGSSSVTGIDFGYNFDTIVNTNNTGQGSLRQFIINSNALGNIGLDQVANPSTVTGITAVDPTPGEETSIFMIPDGNARPGLRAGLSSQLTSGVAVITPSTMLPAITDAFTTIDGRTQTANVSDTNAGQQGTGGTVGTDSLTLSKVNNPEVQIVGNSSLINGLEIGGSNATVRGMSIYGFGNSLINGNIVVRSTANTTTIEQNFLGSTASSFIKPTSGNKGSNIVLNSGAKNGLIQNNLIGYADIFGVLGLASNSGWKLQNNEVRDNSFNDARRDGVSFESGSNNNQIIGNLVISQGGNGIDSWGGAGRLTIENNTITGNGLGSTSAINETPGIRLYGTDNRVYRNIIFDNYGAGVMVTSGSTRNTISQNSIYANGTVASTNGTAASGQIGIDLLISSNSDTTGTAPYVSANDGIATTGGNRSMDYPIIIASTLSGSTLAVKGFIGNNPAGGNTFANATLEFFISEGTNQNNGEVILGDGKSKSHGEGKTYIGSCVADGNSLFNCTFANAGTLGLTDANNITATATDPVGNTSEFSSTPTPSNPNLLLVKRITAINGNTETFGGDNLGLYKDELTNPYDDNTITIPTQPHPTDPPKDTDKWPTLNTFMLGGTNGGNIKPKDELDYTIYFLSTGDIDSKNVLFCDRVPSNVSFIPTAFNGFSTKAPNGLAGDRGILAQINNTSASYSNIQDGDDAQYFPPGSNPTSIYPKINCGGVNDNGAIVVKLGTLPNATTPATPGSYGWVRFRGRVK